MTRASQGASTAVLSAVLTLMILFFLTTCTDSVKLPSTVHSNFRSSSLEVPPSLSHDPNTKNTTGGDPSSLPGFLQFHTTAAATEAAISRYPTGPEPTKTPLISNYLTYAPLIIVYIFVLGVIANSIAWHLHRRKPIEREGILFAHSTHRRLSAILQSADLVGDVEQQKRTVASLDFDLKGSGDELEVTCLKKCAWGSISQVLISSVSVLFMVLYFFVCLDQYLGCQIRGVDSLCYYGYYAFTGGFDRNALFMFGLWCCCMPWYSFLMFVSAQQFWERWVRMPCNAAEADAVFVRAVTGEGFVRSGVATIQRGGEGREGSNGPVDFFVFEGKRYIRNASGTGFGAALVDLPSGDFGELHRVGAAGLSTEAARRVQQVVGPNAIDFKRQTFAALVQKEFCQPFYLYQFGSYMWWVWFSYLVVGLAMASMAILAGFAKVFVTANAEATLEKITSHRSSAEVLRSREWKELDATHLVPGDVIRVKGDGSLFPCDCVLLRGTCVCDEAALTGEARPIEKVAVPPGESKEGNKGGEIPARHRLFAGTIAMQALGPNGEQGGAEALVTATGLQTGKGELLSSILFPRAPDRMRWDADMPVVWIGLFVYAAACFVFALRAVMAARPDTSFVVVLTLGIFTISQTLSPMLPVALSAGQVRAYGRLKERGIVCVNPERIAVAGKVRVMCLDKTGTLTKDDLDFIGAAPVKVGAEHANDQSQLHPPTRPETPSQGTSSVFSSLSSEQSLDLLLGLASCHAVADFGGHLVGNQVEVQMASAAGWSIENVDGRTLGDGAGPLGPSAFCRLSPPEVHRKAQGARRLLVLRRCEFDHARQTMSVVVQEEGGGRLFVFCKGSFEAISARCDCTLTDTSGVLPKSKQGGGPPPSIQSEGAIEQEARLYALDGCYVIALAGKEVAPGSLNSPSDLQALSRDAIEKDLCFMSLLLFRNELKDCTREAVLQLRTGGIRPLVVTGDNAQCGQYIARQSGVVGREDAEILLGEVFPIDDARRLPRVSEAMGADEKARAVVSYHSRRRSSLMLGAFAETLAGQEGVSEGAGAYLSVDRRRHSLGDSDTHTGFAIMWTDVRGGKGWYSTREVATLPGLWDGGVQLAVTGGAWDNLLETGGLEVPVERGAGGSAEEGSGVPLLFFIRLFARMTPAGKVQVIEEFKRRGNITGMVGDGGNDCGALRASHVGVAFSEADASIVSPFTAKDKSVNSVVDLLREGRGALHTSFACFFFALLFGLLFSLIKIASFSLGILLCPAAYLTIDIGGLLGLTFLMSLVEPLKGDAGPEGAAEVHPGTKAMHRMSPTDSLLSRPSAMTAIGFFVAHAVTLAVALAIMASHPDYTPFPVKLAKAQEWYLMSDGWEGTVVFVIAINGIVSTALVLSFGFVFREPVWKSRPVFFACLGLMAFTAFLLLGPSNPISQMWHMASEDYNGSPPVKGSVWEKYQADGGKPSPAMSLPFRGLLQLLAVTNLAALAAWKLWMVDRQPAPGRGEVQASDDRSLPETAVVDPSEASQGSGGDKQQSLATPGQRGNGVVPLSVWTSEKGTPLRCPVPI
uniref:P-type ATPase A domain-containing protein n=1 Tax=Chromera velia CCMP2878 TaxID=1169474 RepID=A0A0G4G7V3_9ALVE|eukprot:Cvel_20617.t1-p1 / transcript=Cvel_20617.t1 / gene=Cvel_20617 / organism=Chromera_velia_CCMP2878 / gene_product=Probable cation-transporting ATPase 13A5, putative / transcript_product=Probable cation-transporting ATPase 13A5, putative / location=Cvel_scaffold1866:19476-26705(-) / protein_length=1551 / sequence_SO=supercontig / SO=protein_coding / is_pseudo=false